MILDFNQQVLTLKAIHKSIIAKSIRFEWIKQTKPNKFMIMSLYRLYIVDFKESW